MVTEWQQEMTKYRETGLRVSAPLGDERQKKKHISKLFIFLILRFTSLNAKGGLGGRKVYPLFHENKFLTKQNCWHHLVCA